MVNKKAHRQLDGLGLGLGLKKWSVKAGAPSSNLTVIDNNKNKPHNSHCGQLDKHSFRRGASWY
jgi:hypothetical protein